MVSADAKDGVREEESGLFGMPQVRELPKETADPHTEAMRRRARKRHKITMRTSPSVRHLKGAQSSYTRPRMWAVIDDDRSKE